MQSTEGVAEQQQVMECLLSHLIVGNNYWITWRKLVASISMQNEAP